MYNTFLGVEMSHIYFKAVKTTIHKSKHFMHLLVSLQFIDIKKFKQIIQKN